MEFENGWHFFLPRRLHYPLHLNIAAEIERKVMTFICRGIIFYFVMFWDFH